MTLTREREREKEREREREREKERERVDGPRAASFANPPEPAAKLESGAVGGGVSVCVRERK